MDTNAIHILLLGTMNAGKSTLINALLGSELMPAAHEATTKKIFCLQGSGRVSTGKLYTPTGDRILSDENCHKYAESSHDEVITLMGNFPALS
ncbi:MAG: dynamin family protein, partial [Desulfovibrionaceae bacterium]|nr:dynamin family protein [Desulfovibrionaceae bacterium]